MAYDVLGSRAIALQDIVRRGFDDAPAQVQGFIARVLERENRYAIDAPLFIQRSVDDCLNAVRFDGYPGLARAGYSLGQATGLPASAALADKFLHCIDQQRSRPPPTQAQLGGDDLAMLGIADGLRALVRDTGFGSPQTESAKSWVRQLMAQRESDARLRRARLLAGDLLDEQGHFGRQLAQSDDLTAAALDLCLWRTWSDVLRNVEHPETNRRRELFKALLITPLPGDGELWQAAAYLSALDVLTDELSAAAVPDAHHVARILAETQGSFRRWRWEERSARQNTMPVRWLIDKEAEVQAFLLAVLYPYFAGHLEDEQYLQGFGLRQGRFDFAITNLGLIVEVKVIRKPGDINDVETEIAEDLALYFKEGNPFKTMIVYIYDDTERPEPEKYPAIRDALKRRSERIIDVVIVRRPSMIPGRNARQ